MIPIHENEQAALTALCGEPRHCSTSEPYFSEAAYDFKEGLCNESTDESDVII